jgi:probable F420-dependent oxidoreductase
VELDAQLESAAAGTGEHAATLETAGYDGIWIGETNHDPFLRALETAHHTERVSIGTAVAIAFARTPMTLAAQAFDLQLYSQGRFTLGIGSQVKAHIERRFSMPWSQPAARMRELVLAIRAIFDTWQNGARLDFRGEFYTHTLMTPFFSPPPIEWGPPPIFLAGVGKLMTEVAGEVCDGFFFHAFTTERYLRDVTLPALATGRARAGLGMEGFTICGPAFTVTGRNDEELDVAITGAKRQVAFYASTPAYRAVLDHHGWGDLEPELTALSKEGKWAEMGTLIDDDVLEAFGPVGTPREVASELRKRFDGAATRLSFYAPYPSAPELWVEVLDAMRRA